MFLLTFPLTCIFTSLNDFVPLLNYCCFCQQQSFWLFSEEAADAKPLTPVHFHPPQASGPVSVLVSSREVSCAPQVLSDLRAVHRLSTEVRSLPAGDYIVSRRAAVVRRPAAGEWEGVPAGRGLHSQQEGGCGAETGSR